MQHSTLLVLLLGLWPCSHPQEETGGTSGAVTTDCWTDDYRLTNVQQEDGSWSARHVPEGLPCAHPGKSTDDLWVTSLMSLCLLVEKGSSAKQRLHDALGWIVALQEEDGRLVSPGGQTDMLVHAVATLALTENCVLMAGSGDHSPAEKALAYLESRALESGGWNRTGAAVGAIDPRTTAWASMAVKSGREGRLEGESDRLSLAAAALIAYNAAQGKPSTIDLACELLVRAFAGEDPNGESYSAASLRLLDEPRPFGHLGMGHNPELVYLRSIIAYQSGGKIWKSWTKHVWKMLTTLRDLGDRNGDRGLLVCDPQLTHGGAIAAGGFTGLTLAIYFRYSNLIGAR